MAKQIELPDSLDSWLEDAKGPVVLLIKPQRGGVEGQSLSVDMYASHARYFESEDQAVKWYEENKRVLRSSLVARYPIISGQ